MALTASLPIPTETLEISAIADKAKVALSDRPQLSLSFEQGLSDQTILKQRYMRYPQSISPVFRLDAQSHKAGAEGRRRAYVYRTNTSPGLLAGDHIATSLHLSSGAYVHLIDQAATKVHTMPDTAQFATTTYCVDLLADASLNFIPEPIILYADSTLKQHTKITIAPTADICWGEIVLPGRLARGECYEFREYLSKIQVIAEDDTYLFKETFKLKGKENPFASQALFSTGPVLGTLLVLLPADQTEAVQQLGKAVDEIAASVYRGSSLCLSSSVCARDRGLFVRAMSANARSVQAAFRRVLSSVRQVRGQPPLPYSV